MQDSANRKHRIGSIVFGIAVGIAVAAWSYQWISDPQKIAARQAEERAVLQSRELLAARLSLSDIQIVDPLATNRKVGKVYIYPNADGWDVSGYYRRNDDDRWHAYLLSISSNLALTSLKIDDDDPALAALAASDPLVDVTR